MEFMDKRIIAADLFCGAGGTSTGMIAAAHELGYEIDLLAINHWTVAVATHERNHPYARHLCENLDNVNPRKVIPGGRLNLLVASPECIHHSRARGGTPKSDQSRASAWHVLRWAEALYIDNILIENVPEFISWGPLDSNGQTVKRLEGKTFLAFIAALRSLDYQVSWRILNCADYGDPTTRRRLFIQARRGGNEPTWPEPTHAARTERNLFDHGRPAWRPARDIIDWSIKSESIFDRKRPLSPNTLKRIEAGLKKYGGNAYMVSYHGASYDGGERTRSIDDPMPTVATSNQFGLVEPFIVPLNHGSGDIRTHSLNNPMPTITSVDAWGLVEPFLVEYYSNGDARSLGEPAPTITTRDRLGLVEPITSQGYLLDIRFRMLQPHELARAQSFPDSYQFAGTREQKVRQIGNAVPVQTARLLCKALFQESTQV
jgi:DNA (cytosine-5)-methyltransferase 1